MARIAMLHRQASTTYGVREYGYTETDEFDGTLDEYVALCNETYTARVVDRANWPGQAPVIHNSFGADLIELTDADGRISYELFWADDDEE